MSSQRVIGLLSWDFCEPKGGLGRSLQWLVSVLRDGGLIVRVGAPHPGVADIPLLSFTRHMGGHLLYSLLLPIVCHRWIRRMRIDRCLLPVGPGGVLLLRLPSTPYDGLVYHTYLQQARFVPGQRWKRIFLPLERRTLRGAHRLFCFCDDTARVLRSDYGISDQRICVLPHAVGRITEQKKRNSIRCNTPHASSPIHLVDAVHLQHFLATPDHLCLCVARLEARKGVQVLMHAWSRVLRAVPDATLIIVGSGMQARRIDRMIAALYAPTVRRIACVSSEEMDLLLHTAQVAVCPSYLEGFGLAAAEAMIAGLAVVASDADGLRGLIDHGRTGLLVAPGDHGALADGLIRLLSDESLRQHVAHTARKAADARFNPDMAARTVVHTMS